MLKLQDLIIYAHEPLRTALKRMTQNHKGILFVCDYDNHLVGVISDGDVRRTLLDDALLLIPVSKVMNTDPIMSVSAAEAADFLSKFSLVAVPVISADGRIVEAVVKAGDADEVLHLTDIEDKKQKMPPTRNLEAVAIIPARGGSKRIPKKNLASVAGRPLIDWAILAAKRARHIGHVIVSTDDDEIADAARTLGIQVPWLRPAQLSQDTTPSLDVILHAAEWALKTLCPTPEWAVLLEPTAPLRLPEHIDRALELLLDTAADCVVSVCEVPHVLNPEELLLVEDGLLRPYSGKVSMDARRLRGEQTPAYVQNGLVYAFRLRSMVEQRSLYGRNVRPLVTDWGYFLDVDTVTDLQLANQKMQQLGAHQYVE